MTLGETKLKDGRIVIQQESTEAIIAHFAKGYKFSSEELLRSEIIAIDPSKSTVVFSMILKDKPRKK